MFKILFGSVVVVGTLMASSWLYLRGSDQKLPALRTVPVERGDLQFTVDATGTVEPEEVIDVGAQVAGKIHSLGVDPRDSKKSIDYGSPVSVGTILARVDDALYQSDVEEAQAQLESMQALAESTVAQVLEAQANVERAQKDIRQLQAKQYQAQRDWGRAQNAFKSSTGALTEGDLDLARSTFESADAAVGVGSAAIDQAKAALTNSKAAVAKANADVSVARANLKRAQTNLGYCTIKSPVDGIIIDRRINVGQTVVSSLNSPSLFLIAKDLKRMQVWVSVNEADIGHIRSDQKVRFSVDPDPGRMLDGIVAPDQPRLNASMNQNVVMYTVVVNTDNSDGRLLPYLTADVQFEVDRHNKVLTVPNAALRWQPSADRLLASGLSETPLANPFDGKPNTASQDARQHDPVEGTIWISEGKGRVRPLKVRTLLNDGTRTEIAAESLPEGTQVVVAEELSASESDTTDPFSPKVFGNRKQ